MTEVTMDTQFGAAAAPADAVLEILVVMDAKYDDPEYMAAMDASSASLAHQAGTAAAVWAGTSVEGSARAVLYHVDDDMPLGAVQNSITAMVRDGSADANNALPVDLIPLDALRLDGGTQSRVSIDEAVIAEYASALHDGVVLPPVVVFFDGVDFWLADGFHRYHAHVQVEALEIPGQIHTGTRRDAVLYSVGANGSHGLRRTNEDKRRSVSTLLADPEWASWSQEMIAKACYVSTGFVSKMVATASLHNEEMRSTTKTVTRNGKSYEQRTEKIGKTRKANVATVLASQGNAPALEVATQHLTPEQASEAVAGLEELLAENAALREELASYKAQLADVLEELNDIKNDMAVTLADNEMMARVFEANDQVKASMAEVERYRAVAEQAGRNLAARSHEFNERARNVRYWKSRADKAEKQLAVTD